MSALLRRNKRGWIVIEKPCLVDCVEQRADLATVHLSRLVRTDVLAAVAYDQLAICQQYEINVSSKGGARIRVTCPSKDEYLLRLPLVGS